MAWCAVVQSVFTTFFLLGAVPIPFLSFSFFALYAAFSSAVYIFFCFLGFVTALSYLFLL